MLKTSLDTISRFPGNLPLTTGGGTASSARASCLFLMIDQRFLKGSAAKGERTKMGILVQRGKLVWMFRKSEAAYELKVRRRG